MRDKLSRIQTPWRRWLISAFLNLVVLSTRHNPRARAHWIGPVRPRRLERALFAFLLFVPVFIFEPREYVLWSLLWGIGAVLFVNALAIRVVVSRRRDDWLGG